MERIVVILVNLGSPRSPEVKDVRSYLREFLSDPLVIDLPALIRMPLVHGIIAPIRAPRSARRYRHIWTYRGFPLIYHSSDLETMLRKEMSGDFEKVLVLPFYPQFATSTTGTVIQLLRRELHAHPLAERVEVCDHFHTREGFTGLWKEKILACRPDQYDAIVFSYHGIPVRQSELAHPGKSCEELDCKDRYSGSNEYCYRASCYQTTRTVPLLSAGLIPGAGARTVARDETVN
jgi:ferrochelatase